MTFSAKDPTESIVVTFDYTALLTAISTASVSIAVDDGNDANAAAMLSGAPSIVGTKVLQRVINGVDGCTYRLRCTVTKADGSIYVIGNTLPVTRF